MGSSFEKEFEAAIEAKDLPGATLVASDLTGKPIQAACKIRNLYFDKTDRSPGNL